MHFQPVRYLGKLSARDENGFMNNVFTYLPRFMNLINEMIKLQ